MDHFAILGLRPGASERDIKKAWRQKMFAHHPDKGGDPDMAAKINAAYEALTQRQKAQSDRHPSQTASRKQLDPKIFQNVSYTYRNGLIWHCSAFVEEWMENTKKADLLSYRLGLPLRKMAKKEVMWTHRIDTIEIKDGQVVVYYKTRALKGKNLVGVPKLSFKADGNVGVFDSGSGDSLVLTLGENHTGSLKVRLSDKIHTVRLCFGEDQPSPYFNNTPNRWPMYPTHSLVKKHAAFIKKITGRAPKWLHPLLKFIRWGIEKL